jgi:hypothetical protein
LQGLHRAPPAPSSFATTSLSDGKPPADGGHDDSGVQASSVEAACTGNNVDLVVAMKNPACSIPSPGKPVAEATIDARVTLDPPAVRGGERFTVRLTYTNVSSAPVELTLQTALFHQTDTGVIVTMTDASGKRVGWPSGQRSCPAASLHPSWARVVLPAGGSAHAEVGWHASKLAWSSQFSDKAIKFDGCPAVLAGPLPKGNYQVEVASPVEIGGTRSGRVLPLDVR